MRTFEVLNPAPSVDKSTKSLVYTSLGSLGGSDGHGPPHLLEQK